MNSVWDTTNLYFHLRNLYAKCKNKTKVNNYSANNESDPTWHLKTGQIKVLDKGYGKQKKVTEIIESILNEVVMGRKNWKTKDKSWPKIIMEWCLRPKKIQKRKNYQR